MKVQELMRRGAKTCKASDTLERAAQLMWDHDCGFLPVTAEDSRLVGVITDRDVCMGAYTQGKALREVPVSSVMSRQVWTCRGEDALAAAEKILQDKRIRRLAVVDADGRLQGVLSLSDVACQALRDRAQKRKAVSDAEVGETLAAICEPRSAKETASKPAATKPLPQRAVA